MDLSQLKIAVAYDWLDRWGGVERVLLALHEMLPLAHFYTSVYNPQRAAWARHLDIKTSFMQGLPGFLKDSRVLSALFYPFAFESFDFNGYDLVLSVSSSFAKSVITKPETAHICYLLTPSRYLWLYPHPLERKMPAFLFKPYQSYMREWDRQAAMRPDKLISISETVAGRCRKFYRRDSDVIYPPFDTGYWDRLTAAEPEGMARFLNKDEFYLVVSRLEPYKRVDIVTDTFRKRPQDKLVVVGSGSLSVRLQKKKPSNLLFLSGLPEGQLKWLYSHAKALIMPQEEDFGYVSLEAQYFGTPVIAFGRGGGAETVINGSTGLLFPEQTVASLSSTIERFGKISYNFRHGSHDLGHFQAKKYSKDTFTARLTQAITNSVFRSRGVRIERSL